MNNTPRVENYLQNFNSQFVPAELARNFERELTEKTNEVARLRGLLNRAIEIAEDFQSNGHDTACYYEVNKFRCRCGFIDASDELDKIKTELARLAPAPEEPVIKESLITEPAPDAEEPVVVNIEPSSQVVDHKTQNVSDNTQANEVARLRELMNRAIEAIPDSLMDEDGGLYENTEHTKLKTELAKLAPAPEEPVPKKPCSACVPEEQCWECAPSVYEN